MAPGPKNDPDNDSNVNEETVELKAPPHSPFPEMNDRQGIDATEASLKPTDILNPNLLPESIVGGRYILFEKIGEGGL